jgi:hypothetical protein
MPHLTAMILTIALAVALGGALSGCASPNSCLSLSATTDKPCRP